MDITEKTQETIAFTDAERQVVEEAWNAYTQTVTIIVRLRGLKGNVSIAPDRSGLIVEKAG